MKVRGVLIPLALFASAGAVQAQSHPGLARVFRLNLAEPAERKLAGKPDLHYYALNVPEGESLFVFLHKQRRASTDLLIRYGALPESWKFDAESRDGESDQALEITPTQGGTYYILVRCAPYTGPCEDCAYTLIAHTSRTLLTIEPGQGATGQFTARWQAVWYRVAVPEDEHLYVFLETASECNGFVAIRKGSLPSGSDIDDRSTLALDVPRTERGPYYIMASSWDKPCGPYLLRVETDRTWPSLRVGETHADELEHSGDFRFYRVEPGPDLKLSGLVEKEEGWRGRVSLRHGALPRDLSYAAAQDAGSDSGELVQSIEWRKTEAGPYYVLVRGDSDEGGCGKYRITVRTEPPVDGATPLEPGESHEAELKGHWDSHFYRISVKEREHLFVFLEKSSSWDGDLAIRRGALPTTLSSDDSCEVWSGDQALDVHQTSEGDYYVQVRGARYWGEVAAYSIRAETLSTWKPVRPGEIVADELTHGVAARYYRIETDEGRHLFAFIEPPLYSMSLGMRLGRLPVDRWRLDRGAWTPEHFEREVPHTEAGNYYVRVQSGDGDNQRFGPYELALHTLETWPSLSLGRKVRDALKDPEDERFYHVQVEGGKRLSVVLEKSQEWYSSVTLSRTSPWTAADAYHSSSGARHVVEFPLTEAGEYFISVRPGRETDGEAPWPREYDLTISTLDPGPPLPRLTSGETQIIEVGEEREMRWFEVEVEEGEDLFIFLEGERGDVGSVSVRHEALATPSIYDVQALGRGGVGIVEVPACRAGTYSILLEAGGWYDAGERRLRVETSRTWKPIEMGREYEGDLEGTWDWDWHRIDVGEGEELFVFVEKPEPCELDLYLRYGALPRPRTGGDPGIYDFRSWDDPAEQVVQVPATRAGSYYVLVRSEFYRRKRCSSYSIRAMTARTWAGPMPLALGEPHSAKLPAGLKADWYRVDVGAGEHLFVFLEKPSLWDGGIWVRHGLLPSQVDCDARSSHRRGAHAVDIPDTVAGSCFIKVAGESWGERPYVLKATISPTETELPHLAVGQILDGELEGWWDSRIYTFTVEEEKPLLLAVDKPWAWEGDLYVRYGRLPTHYPDPYMSDLTSERVAGRQVVEIPATAPAGEYYVLVEPGRFFGSSPSGFTISLAPGGRPFLRGDSNASGTVDISDAVYALRFIFAQGARPSCLDAADIDDDEILTLGDAIFLLQYLFAGGAEPPPPGAIHCGADLTPADRDDLGCDGYGVCP